MKKEKLVIFGEGLYTEIVHDYLSNDGRYEIVAFTKNKEFISANSYLGLPMVPFETITKTYPPSEFKMHLALSYTSMNRLREERYYFKSLKILRLNSTSDTNCIILRNPVISNIDGDTLNYSDSGPVSYTLQIQYEGYHVNTDPGSATEIRQQIEEALTTPVVYPLRVFNTSAPRVVSVIVTASSANPVIVPAVFAT